VLKGSEKTNADEAQCRYANAGRRDSVSVYRLTCILGVRESVDGHDKVVVVIVWTCGLDDAMRSGRDADVVCSAPQAEEVDRRPGR